MRSAVLRVQRAVVYLEAHLFEPVHAADVALAAGGSESELQRLFKRVHGMPMMAYWRARRLTEASRMVEAGTDLLEVARRCGYTGQAAFTRAFTRQFGVPPGQLRREGPRTLGRVAMPDLRALEHREELPTPRLAWEHEPRALSGVIGQIRMDRDDEVLALGAHLRERLPADTVVYGVLLGTVGSAVPYFLGAEHPDAGPESLELVPGLFAQVDHRGPVDLVRQTIEHALRQLQGDLVRPDERPSYERFVLGDLEHPTLEVAFHLAVRGS